MINNQMKELISEIKSIDMNDHIAIHKIWDKEIEVLTFSLEETINYLSSASEEEIYWCSEVWDDISSYFKSTILIEEMKKCQKRFPNIADKIQIDINCAIEAMSGDK